MNRGRWFDAAAIALAVAVLAGIADVSASGGVAEPAEAPSNVRDQRPGNTDARPLALFIGDSYTAGKSSAEMSYGCKAALQMGWLCALSATGGTGYISGGSANRWVDPHAGKSLSLSERLPHLGAQYDPALVVLDGGRNDEFPPREDVYAAMLSTIAEVRRTWREAQIVFIRPRFLSNPKDDLGFDNEFMGRLMSEPASQGVTFIDPISSFFDTDTSGLLSSDGIHPNGEGEERLTTALLASLVRVSQRLGSS
jgi:lysophospholipase L1-like esterase